jgi:hypothetical protein
LEKPSSVEVGTTASVANLPAGTYTLTVSDDCSSKSIAGYCKATCYCFSLAASTKTDAFVLELAQVL